MAYMEFWNEQVMSGFVPMLATAAKKTGDQTKPAEDFQKLLDRQQSAQTPGKETEKTETVPADRPVQDGEAPAKTTETPVTDDVQQLEQQMSLAAMATPQNPVVPVEQVMEPAPVETVSTVEFLPQAEPVVEEVMPEIQTQQAETAVETVQTMPQTEAAETGFAGQVQETAPKQAEAPQTETLPQEAESREIQSVKVERGGAEETRQDSAEEEAPKDAPVETPVFREVREVPIKVGEAPAPEKAPETKPMEHQIADKLTQALQSGETKVEIQLTPENLGKVTVEMTFNENGALHVQLHVESSRTQGLLEKNMATLQQLLSRDSQQEVRVEVQHQQESQQQNFQDGRHSQQQNQQQEGRHPQQESRHGGEDFLHQLRLGLVPTEGE